MEKYDIINAIESKRESMNYSYWRIGLTHDIAERKAHWKVIEKKNIDHWSDWQADNLSDAQDIESYFINKGMKQFNACTWITGKSA